MQETEENDYSILEKASITNVEHGNDETNDMHSYISVCNPSSKKQNEKSHSPFH
jgi:hypothetical protein